MCYKEIDTLILFLQVYSSHGKILKMHQITQNSVTVTLNILMKFLLVFLLLPPIYGYNRIQILLLLCVCVCV